MEWYLMVWKKYAEFDGRSRRKEFWMFALFNFLAMLALGGIAFLISGSLELQGEATFFMFLPVMIYILAALIPNLAVSVRRFHDIGKSGWLLLLFMVLGMIPFVGVVASIIEIVLFCQDGNPGINQYGPNPKFPEQAVGTFAGSGTFTSMGLAAQSQSFVSANGFGNCKSCGAMLKDAAPFCSSCGVHV